jgi:hypothetical protein
MQRHWELGYADEFFRPSIGEIREYRAEHFATRSHPHPVNNVDQVRIVRALVESDHYYAFLFPAADDPYRKQPSTSHAYRRNY